MSKTKVNPEYLESTSVADGLYVVVNGFEYQNDFFGVPSVFKTDQENQAKKIERLTLALKKSQKLETLADQK